MKVISWKQLNYHQKSVASSLFLSSITILLIFVLGESELITSPTWYLNLISFIGLVGSQVSGPTYIAKFADFVRNKKNDAETKFTLTGLLLALGFGIALAVLTPFSKIIQPMLTFCSTFSLFSGFFSRLGTTVSKENNRPTLEKRLIQACAILSFGLSIFLIATSAIALVSVAGVTSAMSGGLVLPIWLGAFFFACSFSGAYVQTGEYLGKTLSLCLTPSHAGIKNKKNEYQGSAFGLSLGAIIGIVVVTALAITQPHIFATLFLALVVGSLIFATCTGTTASLFSKLGKARDFSNQGVEMTSSTHYKLKLNKSFNESTINSSDLTSGTLSPIKRDRALSEGTPVTVNEDSSDLTSETPSPVTPIKRDRALSEGAPVTVKENFSPTLFSPLKNRNFTETNSLAKKSFYPLVRSMSYTY